MRRAATTWPPARWRRSAVSAPSGSATRSASRRRATTATARFPRPTLEAVVFAVGPSEQGSLRAALSQLAEQDPLIDVRQDEHRHEISVSLYGEVQKEVIQATLERDYGIAADFRETTTVCIERPARVGEAEEIIRAKTKTNITGRSSPLSTNPFLATLALRIEPAAVGSGIEVRLDVEPRLVPLYLFKTPEAFTTPDDGVRPRGAQRGPGRLAGHRLPRHDDRLRLRVPGDVRRPTTGALTELVLATALAARRDVGLRAAGGTVRWRSRRRRRPGVLAALGPPRRPRDRPVLRERADAGSVPCCRSRASGRSSTSCPACRWGRGSSRRASAATSPSARTRRPSRARRPSPLDREAWLASLAKRG